MTQITQNNCNVSALRPLEVTCNPTNASSPESQDGSIQLYINGGTSPYTVSWTNGAQGTYIGNLQAGNYTATITDYYGDYTTTITCTVGNNTFYLDEFIKCAESFNPNIYIFYDGTSLNPDNAQEASESMRTWYQTKKDEGFGGNLYEGVIGKVSNNGENWIWWATYPYLGSLTGGTLSDGTTVIRSFGMLSGDTVINSEYNSDWCSQNLSGMCVPNIASFNFGEEVPQDGSGNATSDIYKRINNGFTLTGNYGSNDTRSNGVPFTVTPSMNGNSTTVYGDFIGGDKEYICIIVADEADGVVGLYHGQVDVISDTPNKDFLFTNPFELYGTGWSGNTIGPSNRFERDYESFIQVWEDIKDQEGNFDGYIYPLINNNKSRIPFIQHTVATIEGTTISESEFYDKYNTQITDVGPVSLNLSALTTDNVYSGLTATTAYQGLNPTYQNGPGLKNFDWKVDPTVTGFQNGVIGEALNEFFTGISLSDEYIYTTPIDSLVENKIYKFSGNSGCYSYNERLLSTGQTYSALTVTNTYTACTLCQPSSGNTPFQPTLCLTNGEVQYQFNPSGVTNDYFVWYNSDNSLTLSFNTNFSRWEITPWANVGVGGMVRNVDEEIPTGNFTNLGVNSPDIWTMSEGFCEGIPLTVTANPSSETCLGDRNGEVILLGSGGETPYQFRIQNVSPYPTYSPTGIFYNLPPGNYLGEILDSSGSTSSVSFTIQSGDIPVTYSVSLTSTVTSNATGTRTWNYGVQINPSLPTGLQIQFDIVLTHLRTYRDTGVSNFSYSHVITKNNSINIPYTTSPTTTNQILTVCTAKPTQEITDVFTDTASSVTYGSSDTSVGGTVTQTVTIDGQGTDCSQECRMIGTYNTSLQISNLSISGDDCATATNLFTPISENITISDCDAQP